ncbi:MAG: 3'(2'),5'-bisphosphate nucleotidase, partial [Caulobacteraceae bacterium]|nr:3'(2'),5'-bisphosphate nucleotidase [Caulobacter sp.]
HPLRVRTPGLQLDVVASRSHGDPRTEGYLAGLPVGGRCNVGSSLKFALVADGRADLYPRTGPTMEWDTAAGHAILLAAGGRMAAPDGSPFRYGKPGFRNGGFVASGPFDAPPIGPFM